MPVTAMYARGSPDIVYSEKERDFMSSDSGFTGKSGLYSQFRPSYAQAALDYLNHDLGLAGADLADIGCGTGIFSLAAAAFASTVYAVDINRDMLTACREATAGNDRIKVSEGSAEAAGLPDQCVDAVVAAQAFHFFDRDAFRLEARRLLRPGGQVVLMWNSLLESELADRLGALSGPKFKSGLLAGNLEMVKGFYPGDAYERRVFPNFQTQTRDMFIGRYLSSSYAPKEGEARYASYIAALNQIFDDYQTGGLFEHPYHTILYTGR